MGEGQYEQPNIIRFRNIDARGVHCIAVEVFMRQHNTLRDSRCAGGIEQNCHIVFLDCNIRQLVGTFFLYIGVLNSAGYVLILHDDYVFEGINSLSGNIDLFHKVLCGDKGYRFRVFQDVSYFFISQEKNDRNYNGTRPQDALITDKNLR